MLGRFGRKSLTYSAPSVDPWADREVGLAAWASGWLDHCNWPPMRPLSKAEGGKSECFELVLFLLLLLLAFKALCLRSLLLASFVQS